jgi:hypothetical protein
VSLFERLYVTNRSLHEIRGLGWGSVARSCEHCDEHSGSVKDVQFFEEVGNYQLLKEVYILWG